MCASLMLWEKQINIKEEYMFFVLIFINSSIEKGKFQIFYSRSFFENPPKILISNDGGPTNETKVLRYIMFEGRGAEMVVNI